MAILDPILNSVGIDRNTAGLLGMAALGRLTGNKNLVNKMMMMNMLQENSPQSNQQGFDPGLLNSRTNIPREMTNSSIPNGLNPKLANGIPLIMEELRAKGWQPTIASGIRTPEEQAEKVRLGYSKTMNSKHLIGKAVDIIDKRYGWDGPASDKNYQFWRDLGEAAKKHGFQWGGDWKSFPDVAHIQMSFLNQMQRQQQPGLQPGLLNQQTFYV